MKKQKTQNQLRPTGFIKIKSTIKKPIKTAIESVVFLVDIQKLLLKLKKINMKKLTFLILLLLSFGYSFGQAIGEPEVINPIANQDFKPKLSVSGDFDKGSFMVQYRLPVDSKKVEFRVINPDGKLIVREKMVAKKREHIILCII